MQVPLIIRVPTSKNVASLGCDAHQGIGNPFACASKRSDQAPVSPKADDRSISDTAPVGR